MIVYWCTIVKPRISGHSYDHLIMFTLSRPEVAKVKMRQNFQISSFKKTGKPIAPCDRTALEASFEWSHHRILFTD